jgi:hypothetical protein
VRHPSEEIVPDEDRIPPGRRVDGNPDELARIRGVTGRGWHVRVGAESTPGVPGPGVMIAKGDRADRAFPHQVERLST